MWTHQRLKRKIPKYPFNLSPKERLIYTELEHKYSIDQNKTRKELFDLHLLLTQRSDSHLWQNDYLNSEEHKVAKFEEKYLLLIYPLTYPVLRIHNKWTTSNSFYWDNRVQVYRDKISDWAAGIGQLYYLDDKQQVQFLTTGFRFDQQEFIITYDTRIYKVLKTQKCWVNCANDQRKDSPEHKFFVKDVSLKFINTHTYLNLLLNNETNHKTLPKAMQVTTKFSPKQEVMVIGFTSTKRYDKQLPHYSLFGKVNQQRHKYFALGHIQDIQQNQLVHDCSLEWPNALINPKEESIILL